MDAVPVMYGRVQVAAAAAFPEYVDGTEGSQEHHEDLGRVMALMRDLWLAGGPADAGALEVVPDLGPVTLECRLRTINLIAAVWSGVLDQEASGVLASEDSTVATSDWRRRLADAATRVSEWSTAQARAPHRHATFATARAFMTRIFTGPELGPEGVPVESARRLGVDLAVARGLLVVTSLDDAASADEVDKAAQLIREEFDGATVIRGAENSVEHAILVAPPMSDHHWHVAVHAVEERAADDGLQVVAIGPHQTLLDLRDPYGRTASMLPLLRQLFGRAPLIHFSRLRPYEALAKLQRSDLRNLYREPLAPLLVLSTSQQVEQIEAIRHFHESGANAKVAGQRLYTSARTIRRRLDGFKKCTGRSAEEGAVYMASVAYVLDALPPAALDSIRSLGSWARGGGSGIGRRGGRERGEAGGAPRSDPRLSDPNPPIRARITVRAVPLPAYLGAEAFWNGLGLADLGWRRLVVAALAVGLEQTGVQARQVLRLAARRLGRLRRRGLWAGGILPPGLRPGGLRLRSQPQRWAESAARTGSALAVLQQVSVALIATVAVGVLVDIPPATSHPSPPRQVASAIPTTPGSDPPPAGAAAPPGVQTLPPRQIGLGGLGVRIVGSPEAAEQETLEDSTVTAVQASPSYGLDHTIVALGSGRTCACSVLLESIDGGASWTASPGPPHGTQLILPPGFPADPRIFAASEAWSGASAFMTAGFGKKWQPLPVPPGRLAISSRFDSGVPRISVAATGGVWSYDLSSGLLQPQVLDPLAASAPVIATPPAGSGQDVMVLASSLAVAVGAPALVGLSPPAAGPLMVTCLASGCVSAGHPGLSGVGGLVISPGYAMDGLLAAYYLGSVAVSTDHGATFEDITAPPRVDLVYSVGLSLAASGGTGTIWALVGSSGRSRVVSRRVGDAGWSAAGDLPEAASRPGGFLVVLSSARVLRVTGAGGVVCTADAGATWTDRCPTQGGG